MAERETCVLDSAPLIALASAGVLEEVLRGDTTFMLTPEVEAEVVTEGQRRGFQDAGVVQRQVSEGRLRIVRARSTNPLRGRGENPRLSQADVSSLVLAKERGATLIADDTDLRLAALTLGVPLGGSLSLLALAVRARSLTGREAVGAVERMIAAGWYCSPALFKGFADRMQPR